MKYIHDISELDLSKKYTYADYLLWRFNERVELITGRIFKMSPAPRSWHQKISMELSSHFHIFLKGKSCAVFAAPFDVRLPVAGEDYAKSENVVQPDISVVCDPQKIDSLGCKGAPDLIVEIISKSSVTKDLHEKYDLYQASGVKEYWIIHPYDKTLSINVRNEYGIYQAGKLLTKGDIATSTILPGLAIDLTEVFQDVIEEPEEEYGPEVRRI